MSCRTTARTHRLRGPDRGRKVRSAERRPLAVRLFVGLLCCTGGCLGSHSEVRDVPSRQIPSPVTQPAQVLYERQVHLAGYMRSFQVDERGNIRLSTRLGEREPEVVTGQLARAEIDRLHGALRDWGLLKSEYHGVPDGGQTTITYQGKRVTFGDGADLPPQVQHANTLLRELMGKHSPER